MSDLVKIIMDKDEIVNTAKGPVRLLAGQEPSVESWIASSLVGRGFAHYPKPTEKVQALPEDLSNLTVAKLRTLASERGIEGYNMMKKDELLEALGPAQVTGEPGKQRFEKIDLIPEGTVLPEINEKNESEHYDE